MTDTITADWTRGYPLPWLKAIASVFAADFKPHVYGAFGLPKERDVAAARADNELIWVCEKGTANLSAVAITKVLKSPSEHTDFAGRLVRIERGDAFVKHLAGSPEGMMKILGHVSTKTKPARTWVEAHLENAKAVEVLGWCHFHRVLTKIAASSDIKGLFCSEYIPMELQAAHDIPGVAILVPEFISPDDQAAVMVEAEGAKWADHYSSYNKRHSWSAYALWGYDAADPGFIIKPAEMSKAWKEANPDRLKADCGPTIAAEHFRSAMAIVDRIPGRKQRVRLMRLTGNGELTRHSDITDPEAGTGDDKIARIHIPIVTDPSIAFRSWGIDGAEHQLHFPPRALCYIDTRKPHAVKNESGINRVHLVVDTFATPRLRSMIAAGTTAVAG